MSTNISRTMALIAACLSLVLFACNGKTTGGKASPRTGKATTEAGIAFKRIAVGLPSVALDYVGQAPRGLAGAKPGAEVFFAVKNKEGTGLYVRELRNGKRRDLGNLSDISTGSLSASSNGRYVVYCQPREIKTYIDDPAVTDPSIVAQVIRRDLKSSTEVELFNFRDKALLEYRADSLTPFISSDGSRAVALAYNYDRLLLSRYFGDWVKYEQDFRSKRSTLTKGIASQYEANMRMLTQSARIAPLLQELGVEPSVAGPIPDKERAAMAKLAERFKPPEVALLSWHNNKTTLLKLKLPDGTQSSVYYIFGYTGERVLIGAKDLKAAAMAPQRVYSCNLETGELSPFTELSGLPSTIEISGDGKDVLIVYNPFDAATKKLGTKTHVMRIPLDGSPVSDTELPGDFFGYADITSDGRYIAAQDRTDYGLYLVDTFELTKHLLSQMVGPVAGVFIEDQAKKVAYLDQGILFSMDVIPNPQRSKDWVQDSYFDQYKPKFTSFLSALKYTVPAQLSYRMEEFDGLGKHEVSAELTDAAKPGQPVLMRYDVSADKITSLWFPQGNAFASDAPGAAKKLDYYGCERLAKDTLKDVGWLPGDTLQPFQPSPNPMYDSKTDSFVVVFRDGYWLGSGNAADWVTNKEATLRVTASTGQIAEMTMLQLPEVKSQPRTIDFKKAEFLIRNEGSMKIPETAPIRFDEKNVRLVVAMRAKKGEGPAEYTLTEEPRLCYEMDMYILPEDELIQTSRVDTETGEILGQLDFQPSNIAPVKAG